MLRYAVQGVALAVALIAVFAAGVWFGMDVQAFNASMVAEGEVPPRCGPVWVVASGDTAWDIARECYPGEHLGERAHEILALNGITAGDLKADMVLDLPRRR